MNIKNLIQKQKCRILHQEFLKGKGINRLQLNEKILEDKKKILQDVLNYLLERKYKKLCDFLDPQLPFYGTHANAREMIQEFSDIEESKEQFNKDDRFKMKKEAKDVKEIKEIKPVKEVKFLKEEKENEKDEKYEKDYIQDRDERDKIDDRASSNDSDERDERNDRDDRDEREGTHLDYNVEIISTFEEGTLKKYTMYKIETKYKNRIFNSSHRFQDFKKLHIELIKIIPTLGELPSSSMTKFSTSPDVVSERKSCLEKYLQGILQIEELQGYRPVIEFLNLHQFPL